MKKIILAILVIGLAGFGAALALARTSGSAPGISGKVIALDAGHGGSSLGAQYPANSGITGQIFEKDVNLAVVYALKAKLEANHALVVLPRDCDENIGLKQRASIATAECKALTGHDCDVFLAVHHNGNTDPNHDGTLTIYNNGGNNKKFATIIHDALITGLGLPDEGYLSGGYGSTIYGRFTQALSEGYYITNDTEGQTNLAQPLTAVCQNSGIDYQVHSGAKTQEEADALYNGLVNYFSN